MTIHDYFIDYLNPFRSSAYSNTCLFLSWVVFSSLLLYCLDMSPLSSIYVATKSFHTMANFQAFDDILMNSINILILICSKLLTVLLVF